MGELLLLLKALFAIRAVPCSMKFSSAIGIARSIIAFRKPCAARKGGVMLLVLVGNQKQDTADNVYEDQRAYAEGGGVGLGALVDAPAVNGHGDRPGQGDNGPAQCDAAQDAQDEVDQAQGLILAGHRVGGCLGVNGLGLFGNVRLLISLLLLLTRRRRRNGGTCGLLLASARLSGAGKRIASLDAELCVVDVFLAAMGAEHGWSSRWGMDTF